VLYQEDDPVAEDLARRIAIALNSAYSHPMGGYFDEVTSTEQCSNPHMHLFEAFLAWAQLKRPGHEFWMERAYDLSVLALNKLILSESGCIPEFFDTTWKPVHKDGLFIIEPGHQFEWSRLLARWVDLVYFFPAVATKSYGCSCCSVRDRRRASLRELCYSLCGQTQDS
jgi:mannose-6-phosphate isomerase